ncbi:class I SAM-dependent methyltransferase [Flavobacterium sp. DGU38]|uniref:Class I SAM-dependent methyltransferase n=1 Tax=Flavobacterium calami TaxID=3139144 RepID=A0ABU9IJU9_9FLAO
MPNKSSYNKIIDNWIKARNSAIVNKPVIDFADYINSKGTIFDIGCGTGLPIAKYLSDCDFSITGIDQSVKMIETAKSAGIQNSVFQTCDFFDFETDQKFNGIIAWDSLFHFPKERQSEIYSKVYHLLAPGDYFLFTHGKEEDEHTDSMFGEQFYYSCLSKDYVLDLMKELGFEIIYSVENFVEEKDQRDWVVLARKK